MVNAAATTTLPPMRRWLAVGVCLALSLACEAPPRAAVPEPALAGPQLRFVSAAPGELSAIVRAFAAEARAEEREPLVYVGASWCEPCQYFHEAVVAGELDQALPRLALLELDLDHDGARLEAAGYSSRMVPLFVVPDERGRGTERRIQGSIHGAGSPAEIAPRLRAILSPIPL